MPASHASQARRAIYPSANPRADHSSSSAAPSRGRNLDPEAQQGRLRDTLPRSDRLVGGEDTPRSGPLRVHVGEEMAPRSDIQIRTAAVAHSGRAKLVQNTGPKKLKSNRPVGDEDPAQSGRLRPWDLDVRNPQLGRIAGFTASMPSAEPEPSRRSGRVWNDTPEVTTPHPYRLTEFASPSSSAESQPHCYGGVVDVLNEYYPGNDKRFVDMPVRERTRSQTALKLESMLPYPVSSYDDADAAIHTEFSNLPTPLSPWMDLEAHGSNTDLHLPLTDTESCHDFTTSYVRNDYGNLAISTGGTLRVANDVSDRNPELFPSPSVDTFDDAVDIYRYDRGEYSQRRNRPNRVSIRTFNSVFSPHSMHQRCPNWLWWLVQDVYVEPVAKIKVKVKPRVKKLKKTLRSVRGKAPKEEGSFAPRLERENVDST